LVYLFERDSTKHPEQKNKTKLSRERKKDMKESETNKEKSTLQTRERQHESAITSARREQTK